MSQEQASTALELREPYFVPAADEMSIFCMDDRDSDEETYLHWPGAGLFIPNQRALLAQAAGMFPSPYDPIEDTHFTFRELIADGFRVGIHDDDSHDPHGKFDFSRLMGIMGIGCGYDMNRHGILIKESESGLTIIERLDNMMPELIPDAETRKFGKSVVRASGLLVQSGMYINEQLPRDLAGAAVEEGARTMLTLGQHNPESIVIANFRHGTVFKTAEANKANVPAYCFDVWHYEEVVASRPDLFPYTHSQIRIGAMLDLFATSDFLGAKLIVIRL